MVGHPVITYCVSQEGWQRVIRWWSMRALAGQGHVEKFAKSNAAVCHRLPVQKLSTHLVGRILLIPYIPHFHETFGHNLMTGKQFIISQ